MPRVLIAALALAVAGGLVVALSPSVVVTAVGIALAGSGVVLAVVAAFLAVGESEERERRARGPRE